MQESFSISRHHGHHHHDHTHEHARGGAPGPGEYAPALVEFRRSGLTESLHRGAIAVCTPDGKRSRGLGHPAMPTFMRSAAKPLQALPLITSGAARRYGLTPAELAAVCGSLNGEEFQIEAVKSIMDKAGLDLGLLDCGPAWPLHRETYKAMRAAGDKPTPLHNTCAGKHAAMLVLCAYHGWPTEDYLSVRHPVQKLILETVALMSHYPKEQIGIGVDGCGAPVFRTPLVALAGAYARLAAPEQAELEPAMVAAVGELTAACLAHPEMIAGNGRICTRLMQAAPGVLLAKAGSEGSYALALPEQGLGVALNIEDGGVRALGPAVTQTLHELGILGHEALEGPLADLHRPQIGNHRGEKVCDLQAIFEL